jgi:DNA replication protein DnaC
MQQLNQQLTELKLTGLRDVLRQQNEQLSLYSEQSVEERLTRLLSQALLQRDTRKIDRLTQQAKFRVRATLEQLNYHADRQLNKAQLRSLAQGEWLRLHQNILITGSAGCGKTYLACALGHSHCQQGYSLLYFRLKELLEKLMLAQADGSYRSFITKISKATLLIIDDWGLAPLTVQQRGDLLELIDARYDTKSTLIASQLPIENPCRCYFRSPCSWCNKNRIKRRIDEKKAKCLTEVDH